MVTSWRILCALASLALVAAPARAEGRWSLASHDEEMGTAAQPAVYKSTGRQVPVIRAESTLRSPEAMNFGQVQQLSAPPLPAASSDEASTEATGSRLTPTPQPAAQEYWEECDQCDQCGQSACDCCCTPFWAHLNSIYADFLYLQPTGIDMAHAIQQNGVGGVGTVPAGGRVGVVAPDFTPAWRVGFTKALDYCSSFGASYMNFYSHATDTLWTPDGVGGTIASLVIAPGTETSASTNSLVEAAYDVDFKLVDFDYRHLLAGGCRHALNYVVGVRYGKLGQYFEQVGNFAQTTGTVDTSTAIKFEGLGVRTGLDGTRQIHCSGLSAYGRGFISVLFGDFKSSYNMFNLTTTTTLAESSWVDRRAVPILEYELGINWTSPGGHVRLATGYYTAYWFNAVTTGEYVQAVQNADFVNLGDTVIFEGLVSRAEFRY